MINNPDNSKNKNEIYKSLIQKIIKEESLTFSLEHISTGQVAEIVGNVRYFNSDGTENETYKDIFSWNGLYICFRDFFIFAIFKYDIYYIKDGNKITFFSVKLKGTELYECAKIKCELKIQTSVDFKDWPMYFMLLEHPVERDKLPVFKKNVSREEFLKADILYDSYGTSYKKDLLLKELKNLGWCLNYDKYGLQVIKKKTLEISEVA